MMPPSRRTTRRVPPHPARAVVGQLTGADHERPRTTRFYVRSPPVAVASGTARCPPGWVSFLTGSASQPGPPARLAVLGGPRRLTRRELQVLHLVATGETDQRIAERLYLSRRTINCHVANILAKLDVPSRTAAAMTAARIGLL